MDETLKIMSGGFEIEALLAKKDTARGVVITHPHPLYGGDMYNPVVETVAAAYGRSGYTTLRFNFRGVGSSQGYYDNGEGEQEDVCAACRCLTDLGLRHIVLAGYSFGAWVNARISPGRSAHDEMIMISPPVAFMDFSVIKTLPSLKRVISGSRDDIAPPGMIQQAIAAWNETARFEIVAGADHFYSSKLSSLESVLRAGA